MPVKLSLKPKRSWKVFDQWLGNAGQAPAYDLGLVLTAPPGAQRFDRGLDVTRRDPLQTGPLLLGMIACLVLVSPAQAQNQAQIQQVKKGHSCTGCNLFQADLSNQTLKGLDLSRSRLRQADLSLTIMTRSRFVGADLRDANLYGGLFGGTAFQRAKLDNASLVGANFDGANLTGASLLGANLSGAELNKAHGLSQAQLGGACGDGSTRLPRGLTIAPCHGADASPLPRIK